MENLQVGRSGQKLLRDVAVVMGAVLFIGRALGVDLDPESGAATGAGALLIYRTVRAIIENFRYGTPIEED